MFLFVGYTTLYLSSIHLKCLWFIHYRWKLSYIFGSYKSHKYINIYKAMCMSVTFLKFCFFSTLGCSWNLPFKVENDWATIIEPQAKCRFWKGERGKTNKDDRNMKGYKQVGICYCASSLSCCSAWPWQKLMYTQVTIHKLSCHAVLG